MTKLGPLRRVERRETQNGKRYLILICKHAVPAARDDNRFVRFRRCGECWKVVRRYEETLQSCATR